MAWNITEPDLLDRVVRAGSPPSDFNSFVTDTTWQGLFVRWAEAQRAAGDPQPLGLAQLESCTRIDLALDEYYGKFFSDSPEFPVEFPMALKIKAKMVIENRNEDFSWNDLKADLEQTLLDSLTRYAGPFVTDVAQVQKDAAAEKAKQDKAAQLKGLTLSDIDLDKVEEVNADVQKHLTKGQSVEFLQAGKYVLLGKGHDARYYTLLKDQANHCEGTLIMVAKAGAFSAGEVKITGSNDTANFKTAIRDFSKKKVVFA